MSVGDVLLELEQKLSDYLTTCSDEELDCHVRDMTLCNAIESLRLYYDASPTAWNNMIGGALLDRIRNRQAALVDAGIDFIEWATLQREILPVVKVLVAGGKVGKEGTERILQWIKQAEEEQNPS